MNRFRLLIGMAVLAITQAACIAQAYSDYRAQQGTLAVVSVTDVYEEGGQAPVGEPTAYPTSPEEVVQSFLAASQDDPMGMVQYLSSERQENLPAEGALSMLDMDAPIEGFTIQSAAVNPDPPLAQVNVALQAGGIRYDRQFFLKQQNGFWFIDAILTGP
jgi:hypothetical protein